jgi:hypothetical protein
MIGSPLVIWRMPAEAAVMPKLELPGATPTNRRRVFMLFSLARR